jgi:hypothetical protein
MRGHVGKILVLCGLLLGGCAETVSFDRLQRIQYEDWAESLNAFFYMGSNAKYHYFHNEREMFSRDFRVPRSDLRVKREFELTKDRKQWVRVPLGNFKENDPHIELDFFPDDPAIGELYKIR